MSRFHSNLVPSSQRRRLYSRFAAGHDDEMAHNPK
jgi:hypothetical protein